MRTAEIVAIGDELVHGAMLDTNSRWIAGELEANGLPVQRFTVVGDAPDPLRTALGEACQRADVVVTTGGLGPTVDDRTRDAVAELVGGPLWFDEPSWEHIQGYLRGRKRPIPESNRRQAEFPPGAVVLDNPIGTAPGFRVRVHRAELFVLPGVPREMQRMFEAHVLPFVASLPDHRPTAQHYLFVVGPSEALLGERVATFMAADRNPVVGITASGGLLTIRIVATARSRAEAEGACAATAAELRPSLGEWLCGEGRGTLPELVAERLLARGVTFAIAESCTGGLAAGKLTEVAGISGVFCGGVVAYTNAAKQELLGVPAGLLEEHGAVSEPVAAAMAAGAAARLSADLAVGITGVAGPGGGTAEKPVGTVCFGLWHQGRSRAWTLRVPDLGRTFVRERSVIEAWVAVLRALA